MTWKAFTKASRPKEPGHYVVQTRRAGTCVSVLWWHGEMRQKASGRNAWLKVVLWFDHCIPPPPKDE